jgi:hypothetical protein
MRLYLDAAVKQRKRGMADQINAVGVAIAQAFGEDVSAVLKNLEE